MLERELEGFFRTHVMAKGGVTVKMMPTEAGIPDRLVLMPTARIFLVELKTETGTVSPIQKVWHKKALQTGTPVYVLYGPEGVRQWLQAVGETDSTTLQHQTYPLD